MRVVSRISEDLLISVIGKDGPGGPEVTEIETFQAVRPPAADTLQRYSSRNGDFASANQVIQTNSMTAAFFPSPETPLGWATSTRFRPFLFAA